MIPDILQIGGRGDTPGFFAATSRMEAARHGQVNQSRFYFRVGIHKQQANHSARISEPALDIKRFPDWRSSHVDTTSKASYQIEAYP
jgi:hypothetical protein